MGAIDGRVGGDVGGAILAFSQRRDGEAPRLRQFHPITVDFRLGRGAVDEGGQPQPALAADRGDGGVARLGQYPGDGFAAGLAIGGAFALIRAERNRLISNPRQISQQLFPVGNPAVISNGSW